jgi:GNAT superfamily N-acetyltransferase
MPLCDITVECPVHDSFRVRQVAGMFDLQPAAAGRRSWRVEVPGLDEPWDIGCIVGPSGSGKTTVARAVFGDWFYQPACWPADRAVIDGFDARSIRDLTAALAAVGFCSPPAWLRPYAVLSTGERFRCELARALLQGGELVVFDEFTSVVDRTVAQVGSAAVVRAMRRRAGVQGEDAAPGPQRAAGQSACGDAAASSQRMAEDSGRRAVDQRARDDRAAGRDALVRRFVAVTCHYDVLPWLQPDWVLDMATGSLVRGRLRRPAIELSVVRCRHAAWGMFAPHHYLSGRLAPAARTYLAAWDDAAVAFAALVRQPSNHRRAAQRRLWRISRLVVLPDYQGLGIGPRLCTALGERYGSEGCRLCITTSHPAMIAALRRDAAWRVTRIARGGHAWGPFAQRRARRATSRGRSVVSAEYVGGGR